MLKYRRGETSIIALSIEESAVERQLIDAKTRAELRYPVYDATNVYWERVGSLIEDQNAVMKGIKSFNNPSDKSNIDDVEVSVFINQGSHDNINKNVV